MSVYCQYIKSKEYYKKAVASMDQYAGAKQYILTDGAARGLRAIDLYTGSGFELTILPDRGMDIAHARFKGVPVAYVAKSGLKNPGLCGPEGNKEFLRYFTAGLVTTCGLDNAGEECIIDGMFYPMHGRNTITPAENVMVEKVWEDGEYCITVSGTMRMAALFHENLVLRRKIKVKMGENKVTIQDEIQNESAVSKQYMLMYHCNFGFPLVSPDSYVLSNHKKVCFFDEQSRRQNRDRSLFEKPQSEFEQNTYTLHEPVSKIVKAAVINPEIRLGAYVECNREQLGSFTQWVQLEEQDYVLGLEPGKNNPVGRRKAIEEGSAVEILPDAVHRAEVTIGVVEGKETALYEQKIKEDLAKPLL